MQKYDLLIVGGGMVGLTLALAVRKLSNLSVAIVDDTSPNELTAEPDVRVSAINQASEQVFKNLDVWSLITNLRHKPYQAMHIWDKSAGGKLDFDADDVNKDNLGAIIENNVIRTALWQKAQQDSGIAFINQKIASIGVGENEVFASFEGQMPIVASFIIGADGANSWLRSQLDMPLTFRDYDHHALVATVKTEQALKPTAWQVFLPTGPLAFLPLYEEGSYSIVWSTNPNDAERLQGLAAEEFGKEITAASDGKLGQLTLASQRYSYPLKMRLARDFIKDRAILIGDAAHTIHPLAGQGVNLGIIDAVALADSFADLVNSNQLTDIDAHVALKAFARWRKNDAIEMISAMEAIKQVFSPLPLPLQTLRGFGLDILNQIKPAKQLMIKQALGEKSHMPTLTKQSEKWAVS
ncbi:2-octaprenyl-6-methoxyphenol hydroxylase [Thalassotalea loyana]|uniref:2-octaprenyl-6-methoxyphenol hydroxylase n=1 Tax=Thalassotalea loyana TaxID=280483 RepID=A0ABQ6HAL7_9GAMM|nr:FAD-dependent monooxygenase [Thalassotalea loyana]GLX85170.1 2-octaprenyl-6-methoxyphenol hydroxylase [Thalassotalea loyana]